jgi:tetratricopeptide (TPR) repeat protein
MKVAAITAVTLATLAGAIVLYGSTQWGRGAPVEGAALAPSEEWPICTAMASLAADADWAPLDPDFAAGKKALVAGDWKAAVTALGYAALREPDNADIHNYIGYAYRRLQQPKAAFAHYRQALALNPRHRSAHEHMGEAYLAAGDVASARAHLAALQRICLIACGEYEELKQAIATFERAAVMRAASK